MFGVSDAEQLLLVTDECPCNRHLWRFVVWAPARQMLEWYLKNAMATCTSFEIILHC